MSNYLSSASIYYEVMTPITIALIEGDGIGKEVIPEGKKTLNLISEFSDYEFKFFDILAGGEEWKT